VSYDPRKNQVRISILACFLLAMEEIVEEGIQPGGVATYFGKNSAIYWRK
jgi:hypothetical protein